MVKNKLILSLSMYPHLIVTISINLFVSCLLLLISLNCYIYPMRISHISNQHQSLGKLSQVIRFNPSNWSPSPLNSPSSSSSSNSTLSSSVFSSFLPLGSSPVSFEQQHDTDDTLFFTKNPPELSSSSSKSTKDFPTSHPNNHRHHNHNHNHHHQHSSSSSQKFFYESLPLKRFMLRNKSVTCNDGTKAGYYFRSAPGPSKRWIVFLEGGWYCFSPATCHQRWLGMRNLMTSAHWPQSRSVGGILSPNQSDNPFFYNANHVFVPYCSSDSWSGDSPAATSADLSFLGSRIITEVISELLHMKGLSDGKTLLLAGSSAGAGGVLVNLDRVADLISSTGSKIEVRGLMDSGWFLDNQPFDFKSSPSSFQNNYNNEDPLDLDNMDEDKEIDDQDNLKKFTFKSQYSSSPSSSSSSSSSPSSTCTSAINCSPIESIKLGMKLWNGQVPDNCRSRFPKDPWRCYFGYRLYPTLKTPLFVFQWIYDEAQMIADNVGAPITKAQWNYIHQMGQELRNSLSNVSAYFAPSCISHIVLTKSSWNSIKINNISLPHAIRCWEAYSSSNGSSYSSSRRDVTSRTHKNQYSSRSQVSTSSFVADEFRPNHENQSSFNQQPLPISSSSNRQQNTKRSPSTVSPQIVPNSHSIQSLAYLSDNTNRTVNSDVNLNILSNSSYSKKKNGKRRHNKKHKKRQQQSQETIRSKRLAARNERRLRLSKLENKSQCRFNHIDSCSWPQCNSGCPKLHNPFTGEEVNFLELLKSYGFNLMAVAQALGLEPKALNEMDDGALLQLFHRKVS